MSYEIFMVSLISTSILVLILLFLLDFIFQLHAITIEATIEPSETTIWRKDGVVDFTLLILVVLRDGMLILDEVNEVSIQQTNGKIQIEKAINIDAPLLIKHIDVVAELDANKIKLKSLFLLNSLFKAKLDNCWSWIQVTIEVLGKNKQSLEIDVYKAVDYST